MKSSLEFLVVEKIAAGILNLVQNHDFSSGRTVVYK